MSFESDYNVPIVYRSYEKNSKTLYLQPCLYYISTVINDNPSLRNTALKDIGIKVGNGLLKLTYIKTDEPFESFVEKDKALVIEEDQLRSKQKMEIEERSQSEQLRLKEEKERIEKMVMEEEKEREEKRKQMFIEEENNRKTMEEEKKRKLIEEELERRNQLKIQKQTQKEEKSVKMNNNHDNNQETPSDPFLAKVLQKGGSVDRDREEVHEIIRMHTDRDYDTIPSEPLDRNPTIYKPSNAPPLKVDIPDHFYNTTMEDIKTSQSTNKEEPMLKTKEMRKRERLNRLAKYKKCLIRIKFPDEYTLEGIFYPQEKTCHVEEFIKQHLKDDTIQFYLYITPPLTPLHETLNLRDQNLLPSAQVYFGLKDKSRPYTYPLLKLEGVKHEERMYSDQKVVYVEEKKHIPVTKPLKKENNTSKVEKDDEEERKRKEKRLMSLLLKK